MQVYRLWYYIYYIIIIYVSRVPPSPGYITLVVIDWIDHRPSWRFRLDYIIIMHRYNTIIYNFERQES